MPLKMDAMYGYNSNSISGVMKGSRFFVLKTM